MPGQFKTKEVEYAHTITAPIKDSEHFGISLLQIGHQLSFNLAHQQARQTL
jgi:hypothetical protein